MFQMYVFIFNYFLTLFNLFLDSFTEMSSDIKVSSADNKNISAEYHQGEDDVRIPLNSSNSKAMELYDVSLTFNVNFFISIKRL